jgi:transcriptional regulator
MYKPKFNQIGDRGILIEAMRTYSFAVLFGARGGPAEADAVTATHLPLLVKDEGEHGVLEGHFAKANPHWAQLAGREVLVVFQGPHSYVSPSLYVEPLSVPTWNYIAIHASGILQLIDDDSGKNTLVEELVAVHEPAYLERWRAMLEGYRRTMLAGIVGFRIPIRRLEGKFKLSQNRAAEERRNVQAAQAAGTDDQRELARWMDRLGLLAASATQPQPQTESEKA